jgi:hypothetical protein
MDACQCNSDIDHQSVMIGFVLLTLGVGLFCSL